MPSKFADMIPSSRAGCGSRSRTAMRSNRRPTPLHHQAFVLRQVQLLYALPPMSDLRLILALRRWIGEMPCPPPPRPSRALINECFGALVSFQGQCAARGQIQIPLGFPHECQVVELFRRWWREGFTAWQAPQPVSDDQNAHWCSCAKAGVPGLCSHRRGWNSKLSRSREGSPDACCDGRRTLLARRCITDSG